MKIEEDFGYGEEIAKGSSIEQGRSYFVYNRNPGGALWTAVYSKEGLPGVNVQVEFKRGEGFVTPMNQEEIDFLTEILNSPKGDLCIGGDDIAEMYETEGTNDCFVYREGWSEEDKAELEAEFANSPHPYRQHFLEAKGYEQDHDKLHLTDVVFEYDVGCWWMQDFGDDDVMVGVE